MSFLLFLLIKKLYDDAGKFYQHESPEKADRRIPLLEDLFKTFNHVPINIDIKENNDTLIREVAALIQQYEREKYCVWGNVTANITEKCYKQVISAPLASPSFSRNPHQMLYFIFDAEPRSKPTLFEA